MLEENAQAIIEKCISMALDVDPKAMKLCMERLLPPRRFLKVERKISAMGLLGLFPVAQEVDDPGIQEDF